MIDANINRCKEGLRVCEEVARFVLDNHALTLSIKKVRHRLTSISRPLLARGDLLEGRCSSADAGKNIKINELRRGNVEDIFFANIQRVKESLRVLEEFSKLINIKSAKSLKSLRYKVYTIEKNSDLFST